MHCGMARVNASRGSFVVLYRYSGRSIKCAVVVLLMSNRCSMHNINVAAVLLPLLAI